MTDHVTRIKQLDAQLAKLAQIVKQGEFVGAGLTLSLTVGPLKEDQAPDLELEIAHNLESLLDLVKHSLEASRISRKLLAKRELTALQDFFDADDAGEPAKG